MTEKNSKACCQIEVNELENGYQVTITGEDVKSRCGEMLTKIKEVCNCCLK